MGKTRGKRGAQTFRFHRLTRNMVYLYMFCFILLCFGVNATSPVLLRNHTPSRIESVYNDTTIYIGHAQVVTSGPDLVPPIIIATYLWQDKVNARGGIRVRGKNYNVSVLIIDLGFDKGNLTTSQFERMVIDNITKVYEEFVKPNATGLYGRIDFAVSPYSSTYSPTACIVTERARFIQVSGILIEANFVLVTS